MFTFTTITSRTGVIYNVTKSAVGIIVNKRVGNRYIEKRVNIRIEHVRHSKCRDDFLRRVKENAAAKAAAKAAGQKICLKRQPAKPREAHFVSGSCGKPITIAPIPYESKYIYYYYCYHCSYNIYDYLLIIIFIIAVIMITVMFLLFLALL
jgi:hypothetical protein